jgi:hypothetical protein
MSRTRYSFWLVVLLLLVGSLAITGCGKPAAAGEEGEEHAKVEDVPGKPDEKRVVLTPAGAEALGVKTGVVESGRSDDGGKALIVPYAAVFYDSEGQAFTYTSPAPLTYVRQPVELDDVRKGRAYLAKGPPAGTAVVTVGADEILGAEEGVEEE